MYSPILILKRKLSRSTIAMITYLLAALYFKNIGDSSSFLAKNEVLDVFQSGFRVR